MVLFKNGALIRVGLIDDKYIELNITSYLDLFGINLGMVCDYESTVI